MFLLLENFLITLYNWPCIELFKNEFNVFKHAYFVYFPILLLRDNFIASLLHILNVSFLRNNWLDINLSIAASFFLWLAGFYKTKDVLSLNIN